MSPSIGNFTIQFSAIFINLAIIIGIILALYYVAKKFNINFIQKNKYIALIDSISVGHKEKIILVNVHRELFLVGVTPHNITILNHFKSIVPEIETEPELDMSFNNFLKRAITNNDK